MHVQRGSSHNPLFAAFIEAGRQAGFETTADYNGSKQEGFGPMEQTIHGGRRWSAANAYLRPALKRKNVSLVNGFARRVVIESKRAVGVEIERRRKLEIVKARREVIIAASSVNSPKLLMLSGIGPAAHLREHGIEVVADRPGVGRNLQDHLELYIQQASTRPITLYSKLNPLSKALIGAEWLFFKTGLGASNHFEAAAFVRSRAGVEYPDIQYHFLPVAIRYDGKAAAKSHGFQAHVGPMRSKSRGAVTLRSPDPWSKPVIRFNYMSHPDDWADFRHCIRLTREIFGQAAFDPYRGAEISPGAAVQSDEQLDNFIRDHVESAYHPCGTCRMGRADDMTSVVDPECRVIGVDGLRVADSSIFPRVTNGNLNAPSIMTGEKASDHILGRAPLPPSNREPWINPRWRESDR
jgi:choline dehydrogenase